MNVLELAQAMVHQVSEVILLGDRDGRVWFAGPRLMERLGWPLQEATGQRIWDVFRPELRASVDVEAVCREAMRGGKLRGVHWSPHWVVLHARDGTPNGGWLTVIPLGEPPEDMMAVFRPVESRADEHHLWRAILDSLDEPVIAVDRQFRVRELNTAAKALAGEPGANVVGQPCWTVFGHGADVPADCPLPDTFRGRRAVCRTVQDGTGRSFEASCWPVVDSDGRPLLVLERLRLVGDGTAVRPSPRERALMESIELMHDAVSRTLARLRAVSGGLAEVEVREVAAALERVRALGVSAFQRAATEAARE